MQAAGNMTNFTGVLVKREDMPGQKYAQLVFQTAQGMRTSVSRNLAEVRQLTVGRTYHVRGMERIIKGRKVVLDPTALPVESETGFIRRNKKAFIAAAILFAIFSIVSAVVFIKHAMASENTGSGGPSQSVQSAATDSSDNTDSESVAEPTPTPEPTNVAPTPDPFAARNTTSTSQNSTNIYRPATNNPSPTPAPQSAPTPVPTITPNEPQPTPTENALTAPAPTPTPEAVTPTVTE